MKYAENVDTPTHTTWKSNSSIFQLRPREKAALNYSQRLRDTYQNHPEVRRILKHRQIPKHIFRFFYFGDFFQNFFLSMNVVYSAAKEHKIIRESQKRKEDNVRRNSKREVPHVAERAKPIVKQGFDE